MQIVLEDFDDPDCQFAFELGDRLNALSRQVSKDAKSSSQGFFSDRKLGLYRRVKTKVAVFSTGQSLRLSVGGKLYDISDSSVVARRKGLFWGAKEFVLQKGGETLDTFQYWDILAASDDGDIFEYCERVTRSPESKKEFLVIWNKVAAGQEITKEFFERFPDN